MSVSVKAQSGGSGKSERLLRTIRRHFPGHLPPLMALTDPERTPDPVAMARSLPHGSGLIFRHFGAADRSETAHVLADVCRLRGLLFLVANDPELAVMTGADGAHWPERHLGNARRWQGRFAVMTASAHSMRAVRRAGWAGMDAVLVSPVFPSESRSAGPSLGPTRFRAITRLSPIPVYALGGLRPDNAARIADIAGIASVQHASDF